MKPKLLLASVISMLIAAQAASSQSLALPVPSDSEIRKILAGRVDRFPPGVGIVVGVVEPQGRRIVSYGSFSEKDSLPLTGDTLFEIGSITKVFTSLLLADMVQRGEVALTDPLARYLPPEVKVPERGGRPITLRDLATHTSSLPRDAPVKPGANGYAQYSPVQLYEFLAGYKLPRDIGSKWEYSNLGVGLLGYALALREGTDLETLFSKRITGPLGMNDTHLTLTPELRTRLAVGHLPMGPPAPETETGPWAGLGSLKSSANDMLTFLSAFMSSTNTPLASAMASMLNVRLPGPDGREQALGWWIGWPWRHAGRPEKTIVSHEGATVGFLAFAGYNPKSRVGVVVLTNHRAMFTLDIGSYVLDQRFTLLRDKDLVPPTQRAEIAIDPQLLDLYAGRYQSAEWKATVTREDDHLLVVTQKDLWPDSFYAENRRDFFSKIQDTQISFKTDLQGRVSGFILHLNGKTKQVKRID